MNHFARLRPNWAAVFKLIAGAIWLGASVGAIYSLQAYKSQAGPMTPRASKKVPVNHGPPYRLVMFVHPKCPCTSASLSELDRIVRRATRRVQVEVVAVGVSPSDIDDIESSSLAFARMIPGAVVRAETPGEGERLGAGTSGHLAAFDAMNCELFRGGITRARAHYGNSQGGCAVSEIIQGASPSLRSRPVYGCQLH